MCDLMLSYKAFDFEIRQPHAESVEAHIRKFGKASGGERLVVFVGNSVKEAKDKGNGVGFGSSFF